jgi:hypothetical protein
MEPPNEPIDEPFFAAVRRRHPDIDIVLLPAERPPTDPEANADELAAEALVRVATQARQLWSAIAPGATERPEPRFRFGIDPASVRPISTLSVRRDDGYEVLVRLRHELESHGWDVRRPEGTVERLTGIVDTLEVSASYAEAAAVFVFTASGPSVTVGPERARELTAYGRAR